MRGREVKKKEELVSEELIQEEVPVMAEQTTAEEKKREEEREGIKKAIDILISKPKCLLKYQAIRISEDGTKQGESDGDYSGQHG